MAKIYFARTEIILTDISLPAESIKSSSDMFFENLGSNNGRGLKISKE